MKTSEIPAASGSVSAQAPPRSQTNPARHILVVESDVFLRHLNTLVLLRSGYDVDAVVDGAAARDALMADSYDLMITDRTMPMVSGAELLETLRAARTDMPAVLATGTLREEEFNQYPWSRPAATLQKPYTVAELLGSVHEVLRASERIQF